MTYAVVGVLYKVLNNQKLYLLSSSTLDFGKFLAGKFYPIGGHIEEGETEAVALKREAFEELGIDIHPIKRLTQSSGDQPDLIIYWWSCEQLPHDVEFKVDSTEIKELKWLTRDEILKSPDLVLPATYKFFKEYYSEGIL